MLFGKSQVTTAWPDPSDRELQGRYRPGIRFQFYGMFQGCQSIANVCTQMGRVLLDQVDGVALHSFNGQQFFNASLAEHAYVDHEAPVGFFYGIPDQIPEVFFTHRKKIGGFVCETDRIHSSWVTTCNRLDLIIVPSTFCRQAFLDSGVSTKVMVVPHGLEPEYLPQGTKIRSQPFVFYNTFDSDSFHKRKSAEELIRSFLQAFNRRSDIILNLRTQESADISRFRQQYGFGDVIRISKYTPLTTQEYASIYSKVHVTVHPSKGEGFGLIPFQSIACDTPVIAPAVTGMADYLSDSNAMLLRTGKLVPGEAVGNQAGRYYSIDEDHLVQLMRHAYENWEQEYAKVRDAAPVLRSQYQWQALLRPFVSEVQALLTDCAA